MIHGVRYVRQDVKYISQRHVCPICNTSLSVIKVFKVINSNSEEAKSIPSILPSTVIGNRGLKFRNYSTIGNIKWYWKEFKCQNCCRRFTVDQMKQIEAAPNECKEGLVASFDKSPKQTDELLVEAESNLSPEKGQKKTLKFALCIAIPIVFIVFILIAVVIALSSGSKFVDTNGPENFALTEITRDDILNKNNNYRSSMVSEKHSGWHTNIIGTSLRDCDYDQISKSFGKVYGVLILQATKISSDNLTLNIASSLESGNAEIIVLIDGEYYCSVDVNQNQYITLQNISHKEVIVKLAAEDAKIKIEVKRIY